MSVDPERLLLRAMSVAALASTLVLLTRRARRRRRSGPQVDEVLDVRAHDFARRACALLRARGFVHLRFAPTGVPLAHALLHDVCPARFD